MDTTDLIAEFIDLAADIAPEVDGDLVVLDDPPGLPLPRGTAAYAIRGRDLALKAHLQATGQWRGHYPACIVLLEPPADRLECLGLLTHELGHSLPALQLDDVEPSEAEREKQERQVLAWASRAPLRETGEPWRGHGARFIRRVVHCWFRAMLAGVPLRLTDLRAAGPAYRLSPLHRYIEALGSEPFTMRRWSFSEIEATDAPVEFTKLFTEDVARWKGKVSAVH